ncbi:MAG: hypothetical protein KGP28_02390 [Bdellovibrionales bacterium]|nr:hypothetical protein [Bdellovibrionales bacterium]
MKTLKHEIVLILPLLFSVGCAVEVRGRACTTADGCLESEKVVVSPKVCGVVSGTGSGSSTSGSASSEGGC